MAKFGIYLSQVLNEYRAMGMGSGRDGVSIVYRKADGKIGSKGNVARRSGEQPAAKRDLASIQHENRQAGKVFLTCQVTGQKFELHIPLLIRWNGKLIDHRF